STLGGALALGRRRRRAHAADRHRRWRGDVLVDLPVAVVVDAVAALLGGDEDAGVLALLIVVQIEVAVLAPEEDTAPRVAPPVRVDGAGQAVVAAHAAVGDVGQEVRLVREEAVAVGVDPAGVVLARPRVTELHRALADDRAADASLGSGHAR